MPNETGSQRYIHVEQSFIKFDPDSNLTIQRLDYIRDTFFPQTELSAGKCLILARTINDVNNIEFFINAQLNLTCDKLHGMMTQVHREQATFSFKHGHYLRPCRNNEIVWPRGEREWDTSSRLLENAVDIR